MDHSQEGVHGVLQCLDDFLLMGAQGSRECSHVLATTFSTCEELGVSLAMDKVEGPAASLTFLGIHLCSNPLSVSLPREKVAAIHSSLRELLSSKCVRTCRHWSHWSVTWFMLPRCVLLPSPSWAGFSRCSGGPGRASTGGLTQQCSHFLGPLLVHPPPLHRCARN